LFLEDQFSWEFKEFGHDDDVVSINGEKQKKRAATLLFSPHTVHRWR